MNVEKRIDELVKIINEADYNYHTLDNPTISDQEYDKYLRELINIEEKNPSIKRADSPSLRVGGEVIDSFKKNIPNICRRINEWESKNVNITRR